VTAGPVPQPGTPLTHQESEMLRAIADGHTTVWIAFQAQKSVSAVTGTLRRARKKLRAKTLPHAVLLAVRAGVLS
jgi:DNA-binding CsgD family transcriptional regulator